MTNLLDCKRCKTSQPISSFSKDTKKKRGFCTWCKLCTKIYKKQYSNRESVMLSRKSREKYLRNPQNAIDRAKQWKLENRAKSRLADKKSNRKFKTEIIMAYGGKCACCNDSHIEFLSIDHMNNDGAKHRKEVGMGAAFYLWLRKNKYPSGFQVLCMNCNWAKGRYGYCPHKEPSIFNETYQMNYKDIQRGIL